MAIFYAPFTRKRSIIYTFDFRLFAAGTWLGAFLLSHFGDWLPSTVILLWWLRKRH